MIESNVLTDFNSTVSQPDIDPSTYVHPLASVIGSVIIGKHILVSPMASIRGDEGQPLFIDDDSNVQDGVVIHALETESQGKAVPGNLCTVKGKEYAVYVGKRVSLAHQVQIHGPAVVYDDTFVGMKTLIFKSLVGEGCVIEPGCILMGVTVPDHRYVPAGSIITSQEDADSLPKITQDYPMKDMNKGVVHVNTSLARGYVATSLK
ncbi:MAG TPA: carbonic anhydrase [Syntrophales bacterium]|nr:carbonic anhydrase [Syntrophales bacterium]